MRSTHQNKHFIDKVFIKLMNCQVLTCSRGLVGIHIPINTLPPFIIPGFFGITPSVNYNRQNKGFIYSKDHFICVYVGLTFIFDFIETKARLSVVEEHLRSAWSTSSGGHSLKYFRVLEPKLIKHDENVTFLKICTLKQL